MVVKTSGYSEKDGNNTSLGPPLGTSLETYPNLSKMHKKLSRCGNSFFKMINVKTTEECELPIYCDNKICNNPQCQKHRLYKYMHEHWNQIDAIGRDMKKPKAWIFSTPRKSYPIDRDFCRERYKLLMNLLDKSKHEGYGSVTKFSIHMEIKPSEDTWYLHFHVVTASIDNLKLVREKWGYQIKYEEAISINDLPYYVAKYASKTPNYPNKEAFYEYANATYKLKMHGFNVKSKGKEKKESDWTIIDMKGGSSSKPAFFEMQDYIEKYIGVKKIDEIIKNGEG